MPLPAVSGSGCVRPRHLDPLPSPYASYSCPGRGSGSSSTPSSAPACQELQVDQIWTSTSTNASTGARAHEKTSTATPTMHSRTKSFCHAHAGSSVLSKPHSTCTDHALLFRRSRSAEPPHIASHKMASEDTPEKKFSQRRSTTAPLEITSASIESASSPATLSLTSSRRRTSYGNSTPELVATTVAVNTAEQIIHPAVGKTKKCGLSTVPAKLQSATSTSPKNPQKPQKPHRLEPIDLNASIVDIDGAAGGRAKSTHSSGVLLQVRGPHDQSPATMQQSVESLRETWTNLRDGMKRCLKALRSSISERIPRFRTVRFDHNDPQVAYYVVGSPPKELYRSVEEVQLAMGFRSRYDVIRRVGIYGPRQPPASSSSSSSSSSSTLYPKDGDDIEVLTDDDEEYEEYEEYQEYEEYEDDDDDSGTWHSDSTDGDLRLEDLDSDQTANEPPSQHHREFVDRMFSIDVDYP